MVVYIESNFETQLNSAKLREHVNEANMRNKNLHSKHGNQATGRIIKEINNSGCQDASLKALINTINNAINTQHDEYDKRQKQKYDEEQNEKRRQSNRTVDNYLNTLIIENTKTKNELNTLISDYENKQSYTTNMKELYGIHVNKVSDLQKKIDDYIGYIQTDSRKSFYENQETEFSKRIKKYVTYIYYILLVVYLWYGGFVQNELYKNYYVLFIIFIYILIPYILKYLVVYLFYLWEQFYYSFINTSDYNKKWYIKRE